ncbi:hypothetical protein GCM10027275_00810 [Rhabdobacter roseus]|uniref:Uncharacterized protein n=1 Tax=Rhabdobacter roseus TaxID=1655419 RepID=A0A840TG95_9BACT|nr:hypothetical protein [Rhabdobacter roseus]MBB5281965.1 hypothetical protein [Rhabdobacter roseus]
MIVRSILYSTLKAHINSAEITNEDISYFLDKFYYGLARACKVIGKDPNGKKFDKNIIDIALCLRIGKDDNRTLVSNDGKGNNEGILNTFRSHNVYPEKGICINDYFNKIGFDLTLTT